MLACLLRATRAGRGAVRLSLSCPEGSLSRRLLRRLRTAVAPTEPEGEGSTSAIAPTRPA
jgi:hypothetical protein